MCVFAWGYYKVYLQVFTMSSGVRGGLCCLLDTRRWPLVWCSAFSRPGLAGLSWGCLRHQSWSTAARMFGGPAWERECAEALDVSFGGMQCWLASRDASGWARAAFTIRPGAVLSLLLGCRAAVGLSRLVLPSRCTPWSWPSVRCSAVSPPGQAGVGWGCLQHQSRSTAECVVQS